MLKLLFFCLLIANALLLAVGLGYIGNPISEAHQPQRLTQQLNATQIKLIPAELATAVPAPVPVADVPASSPASAPAVPVKLDAVSCLAWGTFLTADLSKVEARLKELALGNRQLRQNVQEVTSNIVFIPPQGSKEAADKKALELTHLGIHDFFIIQDQSPLRWGISLGVFKTEEAAKQQLANLVSKGVHSARVGVRMAETNKFNFVFKNITAAEHTNLDRLKQDFPAQDFHACSKPG